MMYVTTALQWSMTRGELCFDASEYAEVMPKECGRCITRCRRLRVILKQCFQVWASASPYGTLLLHTLGDFMCSEVFPAEKAYRSSCDGTCWKNRIEKRTPFQARARPAFIELGGNPSLYLKCCAAAEPSPVGGKGATHGTAISLNRTRQLNCGRVKVARTRDLRLPLASTASAKQTGLNVPEAHTKTSNYVGREMPWAGGAAM